MPSPEDAYARLFGKEASDRTRLRLMEIQKALGLRDGDTVWVIFIALEYYQRLYEEFPDKIAKESKKLLEEHKAASEAAAEAAMEKASQGLHEAVKQVLPKTLSATERRVKWKYIWRSVVSLLVVAVVGTVGFLHWQNRVLTEAFERAAALSAMGQAGELNEHTWEWTGLRYTPDGELFLRLRREGRPVRTWLEDAKQCADKKKTLQCVAP